MATTLPTDSDRSTHRHEIAFTGGRVQVASVDLGAERRRERADQLRADAVQALQALDEGDELTNEDVWRIVGEVDIERTSGTGSTRGEVTGWSAKSRSNLLRRIAGLDMVGKWGMLTLTVPGEWTELVPDPEAFKRALRTLALRYERRYGCKFSAVWKMEFQRRGAPHFHVGVRLDGHELVALRSWYAEAWHEVLVHPGKGNRCAGDCEHVHHATRGVQLDAQYGDNLNRAGKAFASYFAKHGVWSSKAYQHVIPTNRWRAGAGLLDALGSDGTQLRELADAWSTPGRWWGVMHLGDAPTSEGELTSAELVAAKLVARKVVARRTWRYVETDQGSVLVRRSLRSLHGKHGFWLLAANPSEFRWWFLDQIRAVAKLDGIERARYLATISEPGARPAPHSVTESRRAPSLIAT